MLRGTTEAMVVSYRNSTSNHNSAGCLYHLSSLYLIEILHQTTTLSTRFRCQYQLYLIEILHQTTTTLFVYCFLCRLYLIEILHQTTTIWSFLFTRLGCILSKFYIKPQRRIFRTVQLLRCILSKFYIKPQHFD